MKNIKIGNSSFIKNLNQSSIFRLINDYGPISRKELSEKTGYSAGTISNHVKTLIKEGFVIEKEKGISSGGRRPVFLTINPNKGYIFGVNIEVKKVKIIMFNLKLKVERKQKFTLDKQKGPYEALDDIIDLIKNMMKEKNVTNKDIIGIGFAVPGLVTKDRSVLKFAPNLAWNDVTIRKYVSSKLKIPILVENEANAAALGEKDFNYENKVDMVYVSINEGIGCGLIVNGKLHRGESGNAGEFGHIIIDSESDRVCHCGNIGCWETLASTNYIYDMYRKTTNKNINPSELIQDKLIDDKDILNIFSDVGENIGIGLANIINSLSPKLMIIGGNILKIKKYIDSSIQKSVREKTLSLNYDKVEIKYSKLGELATVYGIAKIIFDENMLVNQ